MKTVVKVHLDQLLMATISTAVCSGVKIEDARAVVRALANDDQVWRALALSIPHLLTAAGDESLTSAIRPKPGKG